MQNIPFQKIVRELTYLLNVDVCSFYQLIDQHYLELTATEGLSKNVIGARMNINQGLIGKVARTKHSLSVKNPNTHADYYHLNESGEERYHSFLGIPLIDANDLIGVLVVQTIRPKLFFLSEIQALYEAGRQIAVEASCSQA